MKATIEKQEKRLLRTQSELDDAKQRNDSYKKTVEGCYQWEIMDTNLRNWNLVRSKVLSDKKLAKVIPRNTHNYTTKSSCFRQISELQRDVVAKDTELQQLQKSVADSQELILQEKLNVADSERNQERLEMNKQVVLLC